MRFSRNEGQNMEPDVILILIKEGRLVLMEERGRLQRILLNTINPLFLFGGNKDCGERVTGSMACFHGGQQPVIKEPGPERPRWWQSVLRVRAEVG